MSVDNALAAPAIHPVATTRWGRLNRAQTAIDFWGRRWLWMAISGLLLLMTVLSLWQRGLTLGIDFEGGVAWDIPASELSVDDARSVLDDEGLESDQAKIQERRSDSGDIIKVQVEDQPEEVRVRLQEAFAEAAGVDPADVSVASVSASWGEEITRKAVYALVVFLALIAVYISLRFEWRMALTALLAMIHDVAISVGIYSVFGFEVTPATIVAFLTVLGYSLYDSIVVFDRIRDNERRIASAGLSAGDLINVSTNQVLLRSINTTLASALPVASLLLVGAGLFGQVTLREFAIALLVGMLTGCVLVDLRRRPAARLVEGALRGVRRHGARPPTSSARTCGPWSSPAPAGCVPCRPAAVGRCRSPLRTPSPTTQRPRRRRSCRHPPIACSPTRPARARRRSASGRILGT